MRTEYFRNNLYYLKKGRRKKIDAHTCRHTFASMAAESGVDPLFIQRIIGHTDYSTTANIYTSRI